MQTILLIVHLLASAALIALVLLQQGKGADMGAAFGSGASATVFGARGSGSFLTRATTGFAVVFFATSIALAYYSSKGVSRSSVTEVVAPAAAPQQGPADLPAAPAGSMAPAAAETPAAQQ